MYVSRVSVQDIKSFNGPRQVDLRLTRPDGTHAGWTVLAGRNGAGKTTLLRAMALGLSGPVVARGLVPGFDNWVAHGAVGGSIELEIIRDAEHDRFTHGRPPAGPFEAGGTTEAGDLTAAGADLVLEDLTDPSRLIDSIHSLTG